MWIVSSDKDTAAFNNDTFERDTVGVSNKELAENAALQRANSGLNQAAPIACVVNIWHTDGCVLFFWSNWFERFIDLPHVIYFSKITDLIAQLNINMNFMDWTRWYILYMKQIADFITCCG